MPTGDALIEQMNRIPILPDSLAIWGLGQMGVAVKGPEGVIYIDPYLSDAVRLNFGDWWTRAFDAPVPAGAITNAVALLSSHEHQDHLDVPTIAAMVEASPGMAVLMTGWSVPLLAELQLPRERVVVPRALQPMTIPGTSARLTAIPAAHYQLEDDDVKGHRWFGFLIEWNGVVFYHAGDTIVYADYLKTMRQLPSADVAMLPINGRDWFRETDVDAVGNLWPAEVVRLANELGWGLVIAGHNDMFANNAIPYSSIADAFERGAPRQAWKTLQPGELLYYVK